jgi:hypothetical protein
MGIVELKTKIAGIPDPRRPWGNLRHKLEDILVIGLVSMVCDGEDFEDMEVFGREREEALKQLLELPSGIPDESTFYRVFSRIQPEALSRRLYEWVSGVRETAGVAVNIDGKTVRVSGNDGRAALHVVSARAGEEDIILGRIAVDKKSNGITAIPKLLALLDIQRAMVTIDAMGCRRETAAKIRERKADYLLSVKDNQPALHQDIRDYFEGLESGDIRELPEDVWETGEERGAWEEGETGSADGNGHRVDGGEGGLERPENDNPVSVLEDGGWENDTG